MSPDELLETAREGGVDRGEVRPDAVADAVRFFAETGDAASAVELVGRAWRMWLSPGEFDKGARVIEEALAVAGVGAVTPWRVRALYADGLFAFRLGDQSRSRTSNEEALRLARESDDARGECDALTGLARIALRNGSYGEVVALATQARERAAAASDRTAGAGPLHLQAAGERLRGNYAVARELYLESLRLNSTLDNAAWVSMEQHNLGWVELHLGHVDAAREWFTKRDAGAGADAAGSAWSELNWSAVAAAEGNFDEARRRFGVGMRALQGLAQAPDPDDQAELEWLRAQLPTEAAS